MPERELWYLGPPLQWLRGGCTPARPQGVDGARHMRKSASTWIRIALPLARRCGGTAGPYICVRGRTTCRRPGHGQDLLGLCYGIAISRQSAVSLRVRDACLSDV